MMSKWQKRDNWAGICFILTLLISTLGAAARRTG